MAGFRCLIQPSLYMEGMLSRSATFQDVTGSADATAALTRIRLYSFLDEYAKEEDLIATELVERPRASIRPIGLMTTRATTTTVAAEVRLLVELEIEIDDAVEKTHDAEFRYCGPLFEDIVDELWGLSSPPTAGQLNIQDVNFLQLPMPFDPNTINGRRIWSTHVEFVCQG